MDKTKVAQLLYAEFGNGEFFTRQISADTMTCLTREMGIAETDVRLRNVRVGKAISSLDKNIFTIDGESMVMLHVSHPEGRRRPRSFQLVRYRPMDDKLRAEALAVESRQPGGPYSVVLVESADGWAAICPALPGCASQGDDEEEAIKNIEEAIVGWLVYEGETLERRTQEMLYDYQASGYSAKLIKVSLA